VAAKTKAEPDGSHPASHYLYVPDPNKPSTWKIRVKAAHAALTVGYRGNKAQMPASEKKKCLAKLRALYKSAGLEWPETEMSNGDVDVNADDFVDTATFALSTGDVPSVDLGDWVIKTGKIFSVGDYKDKRLEITKEDLPGVVERFSGAQIDNEHNPSQFDGLLGELWDVHVGEDGETLYGSVAVPSWLNAVMPQMKVSTTWNRGTKDIIGLALAHDPRIPDAVLFSEYEKSEFARKKHNTRAGQSSLQSIHNETVRGGAVCKATMSSKHENSAIQSIHDMTVDHGAQCDDGSNENAVYPYFSAQTGTGDKMDPKEKRSRFADFISRWFATAESGEDPDTVIADFSHDLEQDEKTRKANAEFSKALAAKDKENETLRAEFARVQAERIGEQAKAFATLMIAEGRILPAQQEQVIATFSNAALADASGTVTFSNGEKTGMLETFKSTIAALPATYKDLQGEHGQQKGDADSGDTARFAAGNRQTTEGKSDTVTEARRKELLEKTQVGRALESAK
jgi:hypothetical protein